MSLGGRPLFDPRLYLVLDPSVVRRHPVEMVLECAVKGGVTVVQIREKNCSNEEFLSLAWRAARALRSLGVPLVINDRVDVAALVDAQGVHLGQSDLPWSEARRRLGSRALIGVSVENLAQAEALRAADVDYLGVSSVFPTATKPDVAEVWGLEKVAQLRARTCRTLVGIGGIDSTNALSVVAAGADGVAVISAICSAASPQIAARELRAQVDRARAGRNG